MQGGGFRLVTSLRGGARPSSAPIFPGDPNFPRVPPPRGVSIWGLVSCYPNPFVWSPNHSGGSSAAASAGTNLPLYPRTEFPPIPADDTHLTAPLCAIPRGNGAGSAAASTLSPVPSPVISSIVIRSVCRYLIFFVVAVIVVALKISTLHTRTTSCPPQSKIGFIGCFACPI